MESCLFCILNLSCPFILFFKFPFYSFDLFIFDCAGASLVCEQGLLSSHGASVSHCSGFSCCSSPALGKQAQ